ncbi:MAG: hypothetical protein LC789_14435 [Actinobacteria bacterium]|nr:hypothetical protein [Actinomycetota bacterium]MCA1720162.1 hypothetical protein [Actinomycetota bacterium]
MGLPRPAQDRQDLQLRQRHRHRRVHLRRPRPALAGKRDPHDGPVASRTTDFGYQGQSDLDGKPKSTTDQRGQQTTFAYDPNGNPTYSKTARGLTAPGETAIKSYTDYTGLDQAAATHNRKTGSTAYTTGVLIASSAGSRTRT